MNFRKRLLIICAATAIVVGLGFALQQRTPQDEPGVETAATLNDAKFTPHRAIYNLKLINVKPNGTINNVTGKMLFAWDDACQGWTIEQHLDMQYQYEGGGGQRTKTSLATWEAKDASSFRFNVSRQTDAEAPEVFRGQATLASSGGKAHYISPDEKDIELNAATLFPSVHTLELLHQAKLGNHTYTRDVFDGSDEQGKNTVSAFIGDPQDVTAPKDAKNPEMRQGKAWPVHMAFFAPDNTGATPDYEMTMMLLENGVATDLMIDYGDFSVDATLESIEPIKPTVCS